MGKFTRLEEKGRILLPRDIRKELNLRVGQRLIVRREAEKIVLQPTKDVEAILTELKGCIKKPSKKIKPMDIKKIWEKKL
ncbi:MAG: AbrB/MazE/SpoVT family DNA-binding domain-containing protein [Euryarchaeota archaeon]|nr:AbrB/MazE/SpoVT family DNA-binding domain-containing protein [Euryarchaeota archaeon]